MKNASQKKNCKREKKNVYIKKKITHTKIYPLDYTGKMLTYISTEKSTIYVKNHKKNTIQEKVRKKGTQTQ